MPDNVTTIDATIASDNIGGIQYQRVKLALGADGSAADLALGQVAMAASLPVAIASNQTMLSVDIGLTAVTLYALTLTNADTEYNQPLPSVARRIVLKCRTSYDVRLAFVTGKVATPTNPYLLVNHDMSYDSGLIKLASGTVYLASSQAGVVVEIEVWS